MAFRHPQAIAVASLKDVADLHPGGAMHTEQWLIRSVVESGRDLSKSGCESQESPFVQ